MVSRRRVSMLLVVGLLVLTACAPSAPTATGEPGVGANQVAQPASPQRTLTLVAAAEPQAATPRVDQSGGFSADISRRLFVAGLAFTDERGVPQPYLAETL